MGSFLGSWFDPIDRAVGSVFGTTQAAKQSNAIKDASDKQAADIKAASDAQVKIANDQLAAQQKNFKDQQYAANLALDANVNQRGLAAKLEGILASSKQDAPAGPKVDLSVADPGKDPHATYNIHKFVRQVAARATGLGKIMTAPQPRAPAPAPATGKPPVRTTPYPKDSPGENQPRTPLPQTRKPGADAPKPGPLAGAVAAAKNTARTQPAASVAPVKNLQKTVVSLAQQAANAHVGIGVAPKPGLIAAVAASQAAASSKSRLPKGKYQP